MPNEVPKGKKTLLGKLVGRNRGSRSELREAFTPLGMVRSDMVRSDLVPRPAHPNLQHAGEAAEPAPVSRSNTAATFDSTPEKPSWLSRLGRKISRRGKLSREFSNSSPVQTVEHSPASPTNEHSHRSNRGSIGGLMDLIRGGNRNSSLEHASEQHARVAEAVDVRSEPRAQVPAGIHVGRGRAAEEAPGATEAPPVVLGTATVPDGQIDPAEIETEADLDTTALIIMPKSASRGAASSLPDPKCELRLTANAINPNGPVNATPPAAVTQTSNTVTKTSFFPASNIISPTATHDPIIKTEVLEASAAPADQERFVISDGDSDDIIHPDDIIGTTTKTEKAVVEELRVLPVGSEAPIEASTTTTPVILNSGIGTFDPLPAVNKGPAEAAAVKNIPAAKEKALEAAKPGMVDLYMPLGGEEEESEARVRMDTEYHMPSVKEEEEPVAIRAGMVSEAEQVHAEVLKDLSSNVTVARGSKFHEDL